MITVLLEQIIQLLKGWIEKFNDHAEAVEDSLTALNGTASDIELNTDPIPDIRDNTGAIITPISSINTNVTSIKNSTTTIKEYSYQIRNNTNSIATSAGAAAAFAEDCATNTLDIKDKTVTIASDTTQIRADSGNIQADVSEIKTYLEYYMANTPVTEDSEGDIANFDTDLEDYLQALKVNIPADLTGFSGITLTKKGKNLVPFDTVITEGWTNSQDGITATYSNGYFHVYGTNELNAWNNVATFSNAWLNNEILLPPGTYTMANHIVMRISTDGVTYANEAQSKTYNTPIKIRGFYIAVRALETVDWYIPMSFILGNSWPTSYEPYKAMTYPVSFGTTITDGAEIDLLSGLMKVNTTPPTYSQLTPIAVRTYKGVNNIYSDIGSTALTYRETLKHYLDKNNQ